MTLAPDLVELEGEVDAVLEGAVVGVDREQCGELLLAEVVFLTDAVALDEDELRLVRDGEARGLGELLRGDGDGVRQAMPLGIPHHRFEPGPFLLRCAVTTDLREGVEHVAVPAARHQHVAVRGTARTEVGGLRQHAVGGRGLDVGGLVEELGGVAGPDPVGGFARAVGLADQGLAARGDHEVGASHEFLAHQQARPGDALEDVGGRALGLQGITHEAHGLEGGVLAPRVRGEYDDVAGLDGVDRVAGRGQVGVGRGNDAADETRRFPVLDDSSLRVLLDNANAGLAQGVTENTADFHAFVHPRRVVPQTRFLDAHLHQPMEGGRVGHGPGHCLAEPVHPVLVVGLDHALRDAGPGEQVVKFLNLLRGHLLADLLLNHDVAFLRGRCGPPGPTLATTYVLVGTQRILPARFHVQILLQDLCTKW